MIERTLRHVLLERASHSPVVTVMGPRQSGKTTLCRAAFSEKAYVSLEAVAEREYAREDPRGFAKCRLRGLACVGCGCGNGT